MVDLYRLRREVLLYDPLSEARRGGYGFVRSVDSGSWWFQMTEPGASGFGLMIWSMAKSCHNCGDHVSQWLAPGLVRWTSITDPSTELVYPDVIYTFHHSDHGQVEPYGPMIGISQLWVPEQYECYHFSQTVHHNLELAEDEADCIGEGCLGRPLNGDLIMGLAPLVTIMPISMERFNEWLPALTTEWKKSTTVLDNYDICSCSFEGWEGEDDSCLVTQWNDKYGTDGYNTASSRELLYIAQATCECTLHSFLREWEAIVETTPDYIDDKAHPDLLKAWRIAMERYFAAWRMFDTHAPLRQEDITERNAWVTYFLRRFSPYWGPTGLDEYLWEHGMQQYVA